MVRCYSNLATAIADIYDDIAARRPDKAVIQSKPGLLIQARWYGWPDRIVTAR